MSAGGLVLVGGRAPAVSVSGHALAALGPRHGFAYSQPRGGDSELLPHRDTFTQSFGRTFTAPGGEAEEEEDLPHTRVFRNYSSPGFQDTFAKEATRLTAGKTNLPKKVREEIEKKTKKKRGPPLLWSPPVPDLDPDKVKQRLALASRSQRFQSSANRWRVRHTNPTFVDESLFGKQLAEPSFKAPWDDMKAVDKKRPWTPSQALETRLRTPREEAKPRRPHSAGAALRRSQSQDLSSSQGRPIWKP